MKRYYDYRRTLRKETQRHGVIWRRRHHNPLPGRQVLRRGRNNPTPG